jgi:rRNA maturation endonuclease Nob1
MRGFHGAFLLTQESFGLIFNAHQANFSLEQGTDTLLGLGLKAMTQENEREITVTWDLACHQCKSNFEVPAPFGPRDENELECPHCGSNDIERIEASNQDAPQCGG